MKKLFIVATLLFSQQALAGWPPAGKQKIPGYSSTTGAVSVSDTIEQALSKLNGNFAAVSASTPITFAGSVIGCLTASGSQAGCLSAADWNTFNGKQNALGYTPIDAAGTIPLSADWPAGTSRKITIGTLGLGTAGNKFSGGSALPTSSYSLGDLFLELNGASTGLYLNNSNTSTPAWSKMMDASSHAFVSEKVLDWASVCFSHHDGFCGSLGDEFALNITTNAGLSSFEFDGIDSGFGGDGGYYIFPGTPGGVSTTVALTDQVQTFTNKTFGNIVSVTANGAASTPAEKLIGTWFTGGSATTTKPQLLIEPSGTTSIAWSTSGTGLGVNGPTGFAGNLFDFQVSGTSKASISAAGHPTFASPILISETSGTVPETRGGTNQSSYALGDTLYSSGTNTLSKLPGNTTTTKKFWTQTGTGTVSAAPGWNTLVGSDLPNPSSSTLGGVQSAAAVSNQWINSISTSGVPSLSQPAFSNLSGAATDAQMPTGYPVLLFSSKLGSGASSLSSGTITSKEIIYLHIRVTGYSGGDVVSLRFNNDTGNTYRFMNATHAAGATTLANGSATPTTTTNLIKLAPSTTTQGRTIDCTIDNGTDQTEKRVSCISVTGTGSVGTQSSTDEVNGAWFSASAATQITRIDILTAGGANLNTGTGMRITGTNF